MLLPCFDAQHTEAGCDEAGRGCLAGPVMAAAVVLPPGFTHPLLRDSKQLTQTQRQAARELICREAAAWAVAEATVEEIDALNILQASFLAMHRALDQLAVRPTLLLIDGNRFKPYAGIRHECMVKGDARFASIAAASILAKTFRDDHMRRIADAHPAYGWAQNKGYPSAAHRLAIAAYGPCSHHRRSFRLLAEGGQGRLF